MKEDPVVNCYQFFYLVFLFNFFFIFYVLFFFFGLSSRKNFLGIARKFFASYPPIIVCEFDLQ